MLKTSSIFKLTRNWINKNLLWKIHIWSHLDFFIVANILTRIIFDHSLKIKKYVVELYTSSDLIQFINGIGKWTWAWCISAYCIILNITLNKILISFIIQSIVIESILTKHWTRIIEPPIYCCRLIEMVSYNASRTLSLHLPPSLYFSNLLYDPCPNSKYVLPLSTFRNTAQKITLHICT